MSINVIDLRAIALAANTLSPGIYGEARKLAEQLGELANLCADRIADLESQLAEKDKEIAGMRLVVEAAKQIHKIIGTAHNDEVEFTTWSNLDDALKEYENSKPQEKKP